MAMTTMMTLGIAALGLFVGFLSGLLGLGGGIVVVPALIFLLGMTQKTAQGMSLAIMVPMAIMGAARYYWHDRSAMDWHIVGILMIAAVVGTNIGSNVAFSLSPVLLRRIFAGIMILVGLKMFWV